MKTLKAAPVTAQSFAPYGFIADIQNPGDAYGLGGYPVTFHRDMVLMPNASTAPTAFGSLKIGKRPMLVQDVEYHTYACELMMPLDDDIVIHAGPANGGEPQVDKLEAFIIPKGTMVIFRAGAWHGAPFPVNHDATVLISLPERTYLNDTVKFLLEKEDYREINL
ncbi:ureidoglycolate lyase [Acetanaerobacterium elongatum]|uniref:Ureidoglycolate hydrolase (Allantoin degradation) n=1 Tax=Acetanaerobacterium elongatum TaxID=258515 RepID=A0A1H0FCE0_9FIRM|nr:ureidoglycolate lyase [Acetanaerobacterium elongatum]SDN92305.1 Ureidoglycolate hydrolase (allantoin degradation) [Acetanaerobacterium elongatum]